MRKLILTSAICLLCACGGDGHSARGASDPTLPPDNTPVDPPVDTPVEPPATALEKLGLRKPVLPKPPTDASALRAPQAQ